MNDRFVFPKEKIMLTPKLLRMATLALALGFGAGAQAGPPRHHYHHHHHHQSHSDKYWGVAAAVLATGLVVAAVSTPRPAPVYVAPPARPLPPPSGYWYYCPSSGYYYPQVRGCAVPWQTVAPQYGW